MNHEYVIVNNKTHPKRIKNRYYEHILIAEKALGKHMPEGAEVHHFNGDKKDNSSGNLVICQDHVYHFLLHIRQRVVAHGGNPDTQLVCCTCQNLKDKSDFGNRASNPTGLRSDCRDCRRRQN